MKKYLLASLVFTVLLFLWSGITQMLPWGIPTTQKITVQSGDIANEPSNLIKLQPNALTTNDFDSTFNHKISTYTTNATFSWIVTQPLRTDYTSYFVGEIITQFFVGVLLVVLLLLTKNHNIQTRMLFVGIVGLITWVATYGQLLNWWALPATYAIGVGANLIIGWLVTCFIVSRFILKPEKQ
ncbi:MAG: hypothetical protein CL840_21155 [Crocinitomicaceae bacterium]|nr:hypothetical protein [Crocinitomicaceae bacterium]|tara:strand:- start:3173 stop:3721 length:549 start_codon:yes stop_codon:yes gene_type:complete